MSTHNICFCGEIRKIFTEYSPLSRPIVDNTLKELVGSVDSIGANQTNHGLWLCYMLSCMN